MSLPSAAPLDPLRGSVTVSADGTQMVYVAASSTRSQLFLRTVDRDEPRPLAGTEDAADPFFSPDGEWIGFFARGSLQKVRISGGSPIVLSVVRAAAGATWSTDNTITFGGVAGGGLARISAVGGEPGEPVVIAAPAAGARELRLGWPDVLPGGRGVIFTAITLAGSNVMVLDSRTGTQTTIATDAAFGRYSPSGHLIFERRGRLEAARFSLATLSPLETPSAVVTGVAQSAMLEGPRFAFSQTGALLYVPGDAADQDAPLHWLDAQGQLERVPLPAPRNGDVDSAPDQRRVALALDDESGPRVWVGDAAAGTLKRFADEGESVRPTWRPNGLEIAFAFSKAGPFNLFLKPLAGDASAAPLMASPYNQFPTSWSGDGQRLAFTEFQPLTGADIWVLDVTTHERRAIVRTLFDETWARFSPDGQWLAYMSNESGRWEVYVRPVAASGARVRVSVAGGVWPSWSRDGRSLYFSGQGTTMASSIRTAPTLTVSAPVVVPGADAMVLAGSATAGDRLLVRQAGSAPEARAELRVVLEWFSERAPRPAELMPPPVVIETLDDPRVADYQHIAEHQHMLDRGLFIAEGRLVLRRLLDQRQWRVESILLTSAALENLRDVIHLATAPVYLVDQALMNAIAGFNIHRGCLALAHSLRVEATASSELPIGPLSRVLLLEGVNNPDNVGGLFRTAAAFGVELVILGPSCGDPLYRKAIRTSMAATLVVPFITATEWPGAITDLRTDGFTVAALTPRHDAVLLRDLPADAKLALIVGAEGDGLTEAAMTAATIRVCIPMTQAVDSLNVTTAASIAMYHCWQESRGSGIR